MATATTARQAHEARVRFWRVCIVVAFFAVVLSANFFVGATVMIGSIRSHSADSPVVANKTARMTRPMFDGTFCRNVVIDNKTSNIITDRVERCDNTDSRHQTTLQSGFRWGDK